jgi:hypothetical protein
VQDTCSLKSALVHACMSYEFREPLDCKTRSFLRSVLDAHGIMITTSTNIMMLATWRAWEPANVLCALNISDSGRGKKLAACTKQRSGYMHSPPRRKKHRTGSQNFEKIPHQPFSLALSNRPLHVTRSQQAFRGLIRIGPSPFHCSIFVLLLY